MFQNKATRRKRRNRERDGGKEEGREIETERGWGTERERGVLHYKKNLKYQRNFISSVTCHYWQILSMKNFTINLTIDLPTINTRFCPGNLLN